MCIIIALTPKDKIKKEISKEILQKAWDSNNDGAGYAYVENAKTKEAKVKIKKGFFKFKNFYKSFSNDRKTYFNSYFMVHFRYATYGSKTINNCHPFYLENNVSAIAHNGTINKFDAKKDEGKSDSNLLSEYLKDLPSLWYMNLGYKILVESFIGPLNKIAILTKKNDIIVFNETKWFKEDDIWYSSDYYKIERVTNKTDDNFCDMCKIKKATIKHGIYYYCDECYKIPFNNKHIIIKSSNNTETMLCTSTNCTTELVSDYEKSQKKCTYCIDQERKENIKNIYEQEKKEINEALKNAP